MLRIRLSNSSEGWEHLRATDSTSGLREHQDSRPSAMERSILLHGKPPSFTRVQPGNGEPSDVLKQVLALVCGNDALCLLSPWWSYEKFKAMKG